MTTTDMKRKKTMDGMIRFRAQSGLVHRLETIAERRNKLEPEIYREAVLEFVERWEKRLGIKRAA